MSTNRIKLPTTIITKLRAEEILGELATLKLEERDRKTEMDREITAVRERFEKPLHDLGKQIEDRTVLLESWASANPAEFGKKKSIELLHGTVGYRTGTPKLKTLAKWTWDRVLEAIKTLGFDALVRVKEAVNKEAIIGAIGAGTFTDTEARAIGVQLVQDEAFFVEPKMEELAARTTTEAAR